MGTKKRLKILQFPLAASKGGVTQYVLNIWKYINKEEFQFDFVTFSPFLDFEDELIKQGCRVYHMSCYPKDDREQFCIEFEQILSHTYDVIELHTSYWKDTIMEKIAQQYGIKKIIIHAHSSGIPSALENSKMIQAEQMHLAVRNQINLQTATDFWACSIKAADWLYGKNIPKNKVKVINNAIDTERFKFCKDIRNMARKEIDCENKFIIGHVGRIEKEKNHKFIINLFREVYYHCDNAVLLLVGEGSLYREIKDMVRNMGVDKSVIFLGRKENPEYWLQAMDVFIFPSLFEGMPISLVEAQCAGLKCIYSTDITSAGSITNNAMQLPLNKPQLWVQEILKYKNGYVRESQINAVAEKGYSICDNIKKLERLYLE